MSAYPAATKPAVMAAAYAMSSVPAGPIATVAILWGPNCHPVPGHPPLAMVTLSKYARLSPGLVTPP